MRALWVLNPRSRRGRQLGDAARAQLTRDGIELVEDRRELGRADAIVVAGGDGTFAHAIRPALEFDVPIGLVPLGTFNDLARTLMIPFDIREASAVIAAGRTRSIDVACVNDAYYVNEASIGISSRVARWRRPGDTRRFGLLAVVMNALHAIRHMRPFHAEVSYDGKRERLRTVQLTVANSGHFGGLITVDDAAIDDGWLDLYSLEIDDAVRLYSVAKAIVAGKRRSAQGLRTYRAAAFRVETSRPHRITADGEPAGTTPARFEVLPKALRVFAPIDAGAV
ncbi:MAG TPA: YegS/Rv2252/BmrU family lipid kinase [Candidatus Cybelea sp.]|jgi:YegS/Rv2252/BmrU family lipid kinase|nr:YegS/Rv2252/BmrU family lipid kinase [Candidatus Cybelea sp.]